MSTGGQLETSSDERVMAALANFFGLIAALIVWATQKDRSRFVRFQALQAMAFDMLFTIIYMLLMFCLMGVMFVFIMGGVWYTAQAAPPDNLFPALGLGMVAPWAMFMCIMPVALVFGVVRIVAAVSVLTGHDFRYPFIARWVDAFLKEPTAPA
jgi:uncharacterized Tic20 family protein